MVDPGSRPGVHTRGSSLTFQIHKKSAVCVCEKELCVKELCVKELCVKESARRLEAGGRAGYRTKNKNPTQRCGEKKEPPAPYKILIQEPPKSIPEEFAKRRGKQGKDQIAFEIENLMASCLRVSNRLALVLVCAPRQDGCTSSKTHMFYDACSSFSLSA